MEMNSYASPFQIGNVMIPNRTVFAPMAGVSDLPFRLLCHEQGAGLVCMEMISAKAITFRSRRTGELWETSPEEKPVSLQIFGHEPDVMAEAWISLLTSWTSTWDARCPRSSEIRRDQP